MKKLIPLIFIFIFILSFSSFANFSDYNRKAAISRGYVTSANHLIVDGFPKIYEDEFGFTFSIVNIPDVVLPSTLKVEVSMERHGCVSGVIRDEDGDGCDDDYCDHPSTTIRCSCGIDSVSFTPCEDESGYIQHCSGTVTATLAPVVKHSIEDSDNKTVLLSDTFYNKFINYNPTLYMFYGKSRTAAPGPGAQSDYSIQYVATDPSAFPLAGASVRLDAGHVLISGTGLTEETVQLPVMFTAINHASADGTRHSVDNPEPDNALTLDPDESEYDYHYVDPETGEVIDGLGVAIDNGGRTAKSTLYNSDITVLSTIGDEEYYVTKADRRLITKPAWLQLPGGDWIFVTEWEQDNGVYYDDVGLDPPSGDLFECIEPAPSRLTVLKNSYYLIKDTGMSSTQYQLYYFNESGHCDGVPTYSGFFNKSGKKQ